MNWRMPKRKLEFEKLTDEQKQSLLRLIWEELQEEEAHTSKIAKPAKNRSPRGSPKGLRRVFQLAARVVRTFILRNCGGR